MTFNQFYFSYMKRWKPDSGWISVPITVIQTKLFVNVLITDIEGKEIFENLEIQTKGNEFLIIGFWIQECFEIRNIDIGEYVKNICECMGNEESILKWGRYMTGEKNEYYDINVCEKIPIGDYKLYYKSLLKTMGLG